MKNLGKANVKVELLSSLPNITKDRQFFDFDMSSHAWNNINYSPYFPPLLAENITDETSGFSVTYPSKRKLYIDNYITDGNSQPIANLTNVTAPYILWQPISTKEGAIKVLVDETPFDNYTLLYPGSYPSSPSAYLGPQWQDAAKDQSPPPNDLLTIKEWLAMVRNQTTTTTTPTTTTTTTTLGLIPKTNYVNQTVVKDGLWWGIESNDFLNENMPFWVNIQRNKAPSSGTHDTFIIISTGIGDKHDAYDIYLSNDKKPRVIDYYMGRTTTNDTNGYPKNRVYEFTSDLSKILKDDLNIEIGIMTVGGRLIVSINKVVQVFTRIVSSSNEENTSNKTGTLDAFRIAPRRLRIYGSNSQMAINVCPMTFAPVSCLALPVPTIPIQTDPTTGFNITPVYRNLEYNNVIGDDSVCVLPQEPSIKGKLFGVDCWTFTQVDTGGETISNSPYGKFFHKKGYVTFTPASETGIMGDASGDFYVLIMYPQSTTVTFSNKVFTIYYAGCPYFFRLKGAFKVETGITASSIVDASEDVLSVSESYQIDDYFVILGTASVTLYNKGGKYDYLKNSQRGIKLYWGWAGNVIATFTGMVVSTSSSEKPGFEELVLNCQDYMYVLKNYPMVNSPFYDGMVLFYAVQNVVKRAGINTIINGWDNTDQYFLPAGYAFTNPAVKFEDTQPLYECAKSMLERGEACFYFDPYGICHVRKLPGGLYSNAGSESVVAYFTRNPNPPENFHTILDEKNVEYDYSDTVNRIVIATLERDTRNAVLYTRSAMASEDKLLYRRIAYEEQAALGGFEEAVVRGDELAQRVFTTIRKTSFKTTDFNSIIYPLSFIVIDQDEFRLIGLTRTYSAENNDFMMEFNAEWLGG